jgi:hypothetical protein
MYADDATIFIKPTRQDAHTGLSTNFAKTLVVPIYCEQVDLGQAVLNGIPIVRT